MQHTIRRKWLGVLIFMSLFMAASAALVLAGIDDHNVVIVLDASGSMGDTMNTTQEIKMAAAKKALMDVLQDVPYDTNIGLLVFSAGNVEDDWIYPLGPRDDERLMSAISRPEPFGGTPLGEYIKVGADRLLEQRQAQYGYGTFRLLVVTDGEAGDADLVDRYVPELIARGIRLDVIGVDMPNDHTLATKVHSYRRADDPDSLRQAIADVFAEIGSDTTDAADADAFDQLQDIPSEMATAMLQALAYAGNDPIGEHSPAIDASEPAPPPAGGSADDSPGCFAFVSGSMIVVFLFFVMLAFIFLIIRKTRKR
jgi:hypothetical protein